MVEDYNDYRFTRNEFIRYLIQGFGIAVILGYLFYQSMIGMFLLIPILYPYLKKMKENLRDKRKWKINLEFLDGIISLSAALNTGYSAEHAFDEALKDLSSLYDKDSYIMKEFTYIKNQIKMNITVEHALFQFGERTGVEDISSFAEVFATAKRTGGDLNQVIKTSSDTIRDRVEVKREIITVISAKKLEANIMKLMPIGFIGFLLLCSPGFLDPLYHNGIGIVLMTVLLIGYLLIHFLIEKIVNIEV